MNPDQSGEYDEAYQISRYIWRNYRHALTQREYALHYAAELELRARHVNSDSLAAIFRNMPAYINDPEVLAIADSGLGAFEQKCCSRLLRDHGAEIFINRCERCQSILASPIACACVTCGHHWYERRSEMVARAASSIYPKPK
jgi:hypothetical protein